MKLSVSVLGLARSGFVARTLAPVFITSMLIAACGSDESSEGTDVTAADAGTNVVEDAGAAPTTPATDAQPSSPCGPGTELCGDRCVNLTNDREHCGSCTKVCASGDVCSSGTCAFDCAGGSTKCGTACVDTDERRGQLRSLREVLRECQIGLNNCTGVCANLQSDPSNCGSCGFACGANKACVQGACKTVTP